MHQDCIVHLICHLPKLLSLVLEVLREVQAHRHNQVETQHLVPVIIYCRRLVEEEELLLQQFLVAQEEAVGEPPVQVQMGVLQPQAEENQD
jgi:hypothetical protein